jgi:hypothetical protein
MQGFVMVSTRSIRAVLPVVGLAMASLGAAPAWAAVPPYSLVGSFPLQADAWDILPDGRVIALNGTTISAQSGPNQAAFATLGNLPAGSVASFGASFLRMSPDGQRLAVGDNNFGPGARVHIVGLASLSPGGVATTQSVACPNFDAQWADNARLLITGLGTSSSLFSLDAGTLATRTLVNNIGDGSGGITFRDDAVYTGVGYDFTGATTGQIRRFDLSALLASPTPTDFSAGTNVATILSASSLGFDRFGNLLGGGADYSNFPDVLGYARVVDLSGGPSLTLAPAGTGTPYAVRFNSATDELLVVANGTAYRYAVPSAPTLGALALGGLIAGRRRRA